jgi:hypothetical protein
MTFADLGNRATIVSHCITKVLFRNEAKFCKLRQKMRVNQIDEITSKRNQYIPNTVNPHSVFHWLLQFGPGDSRAT